MSEFYPIKTKFTPKVEWYNDLELPTFRTVSVVRMEVRDVDSIIYVNEKGQIVNLARDLGTDKVNASGIESSLLTRGLCVTEVPPIILEDGRLIDGYTRQSVIIGLKQAQWVYLVVRLNDGYSIEDAYDEVGLGANNHLQSKPATIQDFKKRLNAWIGRQDELPSLQQCMNWFNSIPHSFSREQVKKACETALKGHMASVTMESFNSRSVSSLAAEILDLSDKSEKPIALNWTNKASKTTYLHRAICDQLENFDKNGQVAPIVGFLDNIPSEDADDARKEMRKEICRFNRIISRLVVKYQEDPEFEFLPFEGSVGQKVGIENRYQLY
jgi:hypothetical protein